MKHVNIVRNVQKVFNTFSVSDVQFEVVCSVCAIHESAETANQLSVFAVTVVGDVAQVLLPCLPTFVLRYFCLLYTSRCV